MALLNLLDNGVSKTLNSKWSISLFTGKKRNNTYVPKNEISGMNKEDAVELHMEIAQLQQALGKYIASNERKSGSVRSSLNELEAYIKELKNSNARPDFVTSAYQVKDSLLNTMDKFDNNNWKAVVEAAKSRRDIRKYYLDKNKVAGSAIDNAIPVQEERGPIGTLNVYAGGVPQTMPMMGGGYTPSIVVPNVVNQPTTSVDVTPTPEVVDTPQQPKLIEKVDTPTIPVSGLNIHNDKSVVYEGLIPSQNITGTNLEKDYLETLNRRQNASLEGSKPNILGHNFNASINAMMYAQDKTGVVMYINTDDGTYYPKCYYLDSEGNVDKTREYTHFPQPSILHMGGLEIEPSGDKLRCFAFNNPIDFEFVSTDADMPDKYKTYWALKENEGYLIPRKDLEIMKARRR